MRNVNDLIEKATELRNRGLRAGEIADELNISRETATWLLTRTKKEKEGGPQATAAPPKDIFIDWSTIGRSSSRLMLIATCMADMVEEVLNDLDTNVDAVVGIAMNGVPFANVVAYQYGVELAVMHPGKHQTEIGMHQTVHPTLERELRRREGQALRDRGRRDHHRLDHGRGDQADRRPWRRDRGHRGDARQARRRSHRHRARKVTDKNRACRIHDGHNDRYSHSCKPCLQSICVSFFYT